MTPLRAWTPGRWQLLGLFSVSHLYGSECAALLQGGPKWLLCRCPGGFPLPPGPRALGGSRAPEGRARSGLLSAR